MWVECSCGARRSMSGATQRENFEGMKCTGHHPFRPSHKNETCDTVEDLQIILGISRGTVYKLLEQQEFRWFKIGTAYRISKKSFDEWLDNKL